MTGLLAAKEKADLSKIERRAPSVAQMFLDRVAATPHAEAFRYPHDDSWESIVKLFGNACGAVDVSGLRGERWWLTTSQAAAAVMIWFQTAKRLVIWVRHSGALIR